MPVTASDTRGTAQDQPWTDRYAAARDSLDNARAFIGQAADDLEISRTDRDTYLRFIDTAYEREVAARGPGGDPPDPAALTTKARAEAAEATCAALRAYAIGLFDARAICGTGLARFLEDAGFEPHDCGE